MNVKEPKTMLDCISLESCELFADMPISIQMELIDSATPRSYARRERIFFTGDRIKKVLMLVEGCVKLTQNTERGNEIILRLHRPGEVLGAPDWEPGEFHSYTAQAVQACEVLVWDARTMQAAKARFPQLQRNAGKLIARALNNLQRRFCVLATGEVTSRLAQGVVHLVEEIGQHDNSNVEICLSQEELGQLTAVSPWEVCRQLSKWEREGLVRLRREVIEVQNVPGLLSLCKAN
jgi:CRP-like cAMP-binding protein